MSTYTIIHILHVGSHEASAVLYQGVSRQWTSTSCSARVVPVCGV